jgi:hypothetical protein
VNGVPGLVCCSDHLGALARWNLEDPDLALLAPHHHACQVGGEILFAVKDLKDPPPIRDQMNARFPQARNRARLSNSLEKGMGVLDGRRLEELGGPTRR